MNIQCIYIAGKVYRRMLIRLGYKVLVVVNIAEEQLQWDIRSSLSRSLRMIASALS
jgi:hypothetical protein